MLETAIRFVLEKLSNDEGEDLIIEDQWIEEAGEQFKETLRRQFRREKKDFRLRMSNIGRPLCQLQMEKSGAKPMRRQYNHIMRMIHGDIFECVIDVVLKITQANMPGSTEITGGKEQVELEIGGQTIKGEDDVHLDGKVWDIKSASPWAFTNKWGKGIAGLKESDSFGYIGQLVGYAEAQGKQPGGWVVGDKSSGEIMVVECHLNDFEKQKILLDLARTVEKVSSDAPLERQFDPELDMWQRKPTGLRRLPKDTCGFCDFVSTCWPEAKYKPHPNSKAQNPPHYWFVD